MSMPKRLLTRLRSYARDEGGSATVEAAIAFPILMWLFVVTFALFDLYQFKSAREKATYTLADMISRETIPIDQTYLDNALALFNDMTGGSNQLRVSVVYYSADYDRYWKKWSKTVGTGDMASYKDKDLGTKHDWFPVMVDAEQLVVVESKASYDSPFNVGFTPKTVETYAFTRPRFAPQVCFDTCY